MMLNLKKYILLFFAIVSFSLSVCQAASFIISAPRQVYQGDKFYVTYIIKDGTANDIKNVNIPGAKLLYGPTNTGMSSSTVTVNGKTTSSSSSEYTSTYKAEKTGKYNVSGTTAVVNGRSVSCRGFSIEILPPNKNASQNNASGGGINMPNISSQVDDNISSKDVFIRISLSKDAAYEQEAIVCSIKLYSRFDVGSLISTSTPSFNGFLIEKLPIVSAFNKIEKIHGTSYQVAELEKYILFPQQSGKLTITSGDYDLSVIQYQKQSSRFGGYSIVPIDSKVRVRSNSASINIIPLPEPKPTSFTGAVGNFTISDKFSTNKFRTFDAANYTILIKGTGNLKYVKAPTVHFPSQFEVYDPQTTPSVSPAGSNMSGVLSCQYTFVPEYIGKFNIPATEFTYFDPGQKKYITISTVSHSLDIAKGDASKAEIYKKMQKNKDILPLITGDLNLDKNISYFVSSPVYYIWYLLPLIILIVIAFIYRKTIRERADIQFMRTKKAGKVARKRIKLAKSFMQSHNDTKFYTEMLKAIWGYLSDKLTIPVSELNKENIVSELVNYGASEDTTAKLMRILDTCEFEQYSPEQSDTQMENIYSDTSDLMDELEKIKKNKK